MGAVVIILLFVIAALLWGWHQANNTTDEALYLAKSIADTRDKLADRVAELERIYL